MGKIAQFVLGPAGAGKTTYCSVMFQHCQNLKRNVHIINLDPAAEDLPYEPSIDIRELISLEDAMDELKYGPNGGLVFCLEFLLENIEWLLEQLGDFADDYLIVDCPGQIELYSHMSVMTNILKEFANSSYSMCTLYLLDSNFLSEPARFISGSLAALSSMIRLEKSHINVLTKMDLIKKDRRQEKFFAKRNRAPLLFGVLFHNALADQLFDGSAPLLDDNDDDSDNEYDLDLQRYFSVDVPSISAELDATTTPAMRGLNAAIGTLLDEFGLVSFVPLDVTNEDSIGLLMQRVDHVTQFGEDADVAVPRDSELDEPTGGERFVA